MEDCLERIAVRELLGEDEPDGYIETLDTMFEAWLCSDHADGTNGLQRSVAYTRFKAIKRLMNSIK